MLNIYLSKPIKFYLFIANVATAAVAGVVAAKDIDVAVWYFCCCKMVSKT